MIFVNERAKALYCPISALGEAKKRPLNPRRPEGTVPGGASVRADTEHQRLVHVTAVPYLLGLTVDRAGVRFEGDRTVRC